MAARTLIAALALLAMTPGARAQSPSPEFDALAGLDLYTPNRQPRARIVGLGRRLFFDPALSSDGLMACATCHRPDHAFADDRAVARGRPDRPGKRNVPSLVNRAHARVFGWDGRAESLEQQSIRPIAEASEMALPLPAAVERLRLDPSYVRAFQDAFGRDPDISALGAALAAYVRTIQAGDSRFDRFVAGDSTALTPLERRGLDLFQGRARCDRCHSGPLLSDELFHNTGVAWRTGTPTDSGRSAITGRAADIGAFRTPSLREVARTAPYMHDGSLETLEDVIEFYDRGGRANPVLDPLLRQLDLDASEKAALVAYLRALSGRVLEWASGNPAG